MSLSPNPVIKFVSAKNMGLIKMQDQFQFEQIKF